MENNLVSIIIRTCSEERISLLENAVLSIIANDYRPIQIVIVVQTDKEEFIRKVYSCISKLNQQNIHINMVTNYTSKDERAKNLNLGIKIATGKYLGFLDDDDIFYPHHLETIIKSLKTSNGDIAWAYTDVLVPLCTIEDGHNIKILSSEYPYKREQFSIDDFFQNNFIPLHCYLLDRSKIDSSLIQFEETLKVTEDYAFLLRIAIHHKPLYIPETTCEYRFWADGSNTNYHADILTGKEYKSKLRIWKESATKVEILKLQINPAYKSVSLVSLKTRQDFISRYPNLYQFKYKFPQIWNFIVTLVVNLKIIK